MVEINSGWEMVFTHYKTSELLQSLGLGIKKEKVGRNPQWVPKDAVEEQTNLKFSKPIKPIFCTK